MHQDAKNSPALAVAGIFFLVAVTFLAWSRGTYYPWDSGSEPGIIIADLRPILRALAG
jgi:hypothetical protein